ncbi:MAG TPA: fused MFS/spermidine synthase [Candidatus Polarisedimenticolia bacterium]|nr:fused MFS/spermidine synthase [Candidatus Polarisedimenticolia bacterium]
MLSDRAGLNNERAGRIPLLIIFFLSGASGLVYQVVWSRSLVLVFGSTTHAVSTVLAAFMGGLALGSILVGRRGDRMAAPLRAYAIIEVAIAGLAVSVLLILPALVPVYRLAWSAAGASPAALNGLRFVMACLVLLPPTTLMGATLPILSAHLERGPGGRGRTRGSGAGALYASNTTGAVAGTAAAGFLLLPALGMMSSALVAAAANLIAAAAAFRLARLSGESSRADAGAPPPAAQPIAAPAAPRTTATFGILLVAFAASGAGALIFEVVWTRILSLVLGSSTQAFTIMLTTFLAGLALGSAAATRLLPRIANPLLVFALIEIGAGLTAFLGIYLFPELPWVFLKLFRGVGGSSPVFQVGRFLIAALVMLPPTLLLGAAFPLAAHAALLRRGEVSSPVAILYTANTIGAIAGSLVAGFRLIPVVGLQGGLVVGCMVNLAAGALLLAFNPSGRPALRYALAGALILCLPGLVVGAPRWNAMLMSSGVYQYAPRYLQQFQSRRDFLRYHGEQSPLYYKDGPTTTVSVEQRAEKIDGQVNIVLSVNGKVDASSVGDMDTQVLLAQLPLLASPAAWSVMVIGMGSGVSAGSALTHPIEKLAIVEIEPAIMEAQAFFEQVNGRPLEDPRVTVRINDARNDLLVSPETYDVIISEPSNPWITGPSRLFTLEFFELARRRLNDGGILCQWVQLYGMDADALKALLRTFGRVFPHRMVFKGNQGDLVILGSASPLRLDLESMRSRIGQPGVAADLARIQVRDASDLLARFRLGDRGLETYTGSDGTGPINTDDNALVEFAAARSLYRDDHQANDRELADVADSVLPQVILPADEAAAFPAHLAHRLIRSGLTGRAGIVLESALGDQGLPIESRAALIALRGDLLARQGDLAGASGAWREALALRPGQPRAAQGLAARLMAQGDPAGAASLLNAAAGDPACRVELARALLLLGDPHGAIDALEVFRAGDGGAYGAALDDPELAPLLHLHRGRALLAAGDPTGAVASLSRYFDLFPTTPRPAETSIEAATDLARAHLALGRTDEAVAQFRVVTGLADSLASWNRKQADAAVEKRELPAAARHLRTALRYNPQDAGSLRLLGYTLNDLGEHAEAIDVWRDLNRRLDGDMEALRNIAGLALKLERPSEAVEAFRRMKPLEGDPAILAWIDAEILRIETAGGR